MENVCDINKDDKHFLSNFCGEKPHKILKDTVICYMLLFVRFIWLIKKQFANKSRKYFKSFNLLTICLVIASLSCRGIC